MTRKELESVPVPRGMMQVAMTRVRLHFGLQFYQSPFEQRLAALYLQGLHDAVDAEERRTR